MNSTAQLVQKYYDSFNRQDLEGMLQCLHPQVVHEINEGPSEIGLHAFRNFLIRMNEHYREKLENLVVLTDPSGHAACAQFLVKGTYLQTDGGLPPARGQTYSISAVGSFEIRENKIYKVATYYNLKKWIELVK